MEDMEDKVKAAKQGQLMNLGQATRKFFIFFLQLLSWKLFQNILKHKFRFNLQSISLALSVEKGVTIYLPTHRPK